MTLLSIPRVVALYICVAVGANAGTPELPDALQGVVVHENPKQALAALFEAPDGHSMALSDIDAPLTVVNFWATWCAPCVHEMPSLSKLREMSLDDFEVVTIATGRNSEASLKRFYETTGITNLPTYRDPKQALAREAAVLGLPLTLIIDSDGREVARYQGDTNWADADVITWLRAFSAQTVGTQ
ncbi:MAG: TlpA disulfide reductase family protein [Pseudomonadota bacterium]